jgi:YHS domain-containing protein
LAPLEAWAEDEGERALCIVCHVEEGTTARETVHATRVHQGRAYRFCSDRCAGVFDRDPEKYVRAMQTAPADSLFQGGLFSSVSSAPT